ncbi:hypothetical protein HMPREF0973_02046 [Prevotella veroralis F0319]|uniref:Uncharacterized protein n=1 Tax=Prevotella veroralis F0319 TaxID=649761 RepID=C9MR11_9BACT|nr:hypothetical protein HMPREF0973_02046 [Prevotella veroralis F0319]
MRHSLHLGRAFLLYIRFKDCRDRRPRLSVSKSLFMQQKTILFGQTRASVPTFMLCL